MVIVSILPHAEFGPNDHQEDALHFICVTLVSYFIQENQFFDKTNFEKNLGINFQTNLNFQMLRRLYRQNALKVPVRTAFLSIPGRLHRIDEVTDYFTKNEGTGFISKRVIFGPKRFGEF